MGENACGGSGSTCAHSGGVGGLLLRGLCLQAFALILSEFQNQSTHSLTFLFCLIRPDGVDPRTAKTGTRVSGSQHHHHGGKPVIAHIPAFAVRIDLDGENAHFKERK